MKQFGSVATRTAKINIKEHYFASAGISLHRRFYDGLRLMMCLRSSIFDMFALRKCVSVRLFAVKPCFSLKCVTLNSHYTKANPQGITFFSSQSMSLIDQIGFSSELYIDLISHQAQEWINPFTPGNFAEKKTCFEASQAVFWSLLCYKDLKLITKAFTGCTLPSLLI